MSFRKEDLDALERFLEGRKVVPLIEAANGYPYDVAMRHDVDHDIHKALRFAAWESERGTRSTYFILHTAPYWSDKALVPKVAHEMEAMGHEVGIHHDAAGEAARRLGKKADERDLDELACNILANSIGWLRATGLTIKGAAAHGSGDADNVAFIERATPEQFGLVYEAYVLMRGTNYISDNHGYWRSPLEHVDGKPAHVLVHPEHWPV